MFMLAPLLAALPLAPSALQAQNPTPPAENPPAQPTGLQWKDLISEGNKFKIYGFLRLDLQYDDSRPNNTQTIGYILSEDPTAPAPIGAGGKNKEDMTMHARLTRLGIDFDGGVVDSWDNAKLTGKIEVDFFNSGLSGQTESRAALRMRHAYLKLNWTEWSLLFGQTVDVISPLMPVVNNDLVMWGAGNLGDRRPQMRTEWVRKEDAHRYIFQAEIGLTGADDNIDLDNAGTYGAGYRDGETSGLPTLQARVAYGFELGGQKAEVGLWGDQAWEKSDTSFAGNDEFNSYAVGMRPNSVI
jgi:hypothetical protein